MANFRGEGTATRAAHHAALIAAAGAALLVFASAAFMTGPARAAAGALSEADQTCLACHASKDLKKELPNGETLALHVDAEAFAKSVHKVLGCAACHSGVDLKKHPAEARKVSSAREYSIAQTETCRQCHQDAFKQHEGSVHAARLREGNSAAPVCTDCHDSHAVSPRTAYETCVGCHAAALAAHQKWLPNAGLHHEVVSCAACHAPMALRMLDLRLYDGATRRWVSENEGSPWFEKLARSADGDGNGLDPGELRNLMKEINRDGTAAPKTLRGRMELRTGAEAHRLSDKAQAIKACDSCHRFGAEPFQNITVSITGPDGRPVRYRAHQGVLGSVLSVDSLREFYAIGGTRSKLLDLLFVFALLGGIGVPLGHMTAKWFIRRRLKTREGQNASAGTPTEKPSLPGDRPGGGNAPGSLSE